MRSLIGMLGLALASAQSPDAFPSRLSGLAPSPTTPMVVFLAGFPDDTHSFDAVAPAFEGTHTVLKLALPGYEGAPISAKWGLPFTTLVEKMHDAVEAQAHGDLHLVVHDWGAYLGLLYSEKYSTEVVKLALLDIGHQTMADAAEMTLMEKVVGATYQLFLAWCFVVDAIGLRPLAALAQMLFPWQTIGPCPHEFALPAKVEEWFSAPDFKICYPYYVLWKQILTGTAWMPAMPSMPTLFVWGTRKRMRFHTSRFTKDLDARDDGSRSVALDCGHFMQAQLPAEVAFQLLSFFAPETVGPCAAYASSVKLEDCNEFGVGPDVQGDLSAMRSCHRCVSDRIDADCAPGTDCEAFRLREEEDFKAFLEKEAREAEL
jgi:pimeloyl-ACP methyl ester carboxylesterase